MKKRIYIRGTDILCRSLNENEIPAADPYCMLAAAIIFQAAKDCSSWSPELENPMGETSSLNGLMYRRKAKLLQFINSDWVDTLLSWQHDIHPEAVCEELVRRLRHEAV